MNAKLLFLLVIILGFLPVFENAVQAQNYNLEVGTERYFKEFGGLGDMPEPLGIGAISMGRETVIGEIEIDGITWSKVLWERTANYDYPMEHIRRDTTLLREQEGKLYEFKANEGEKLIFDYRFSVGDSILEHFEPFLPERCLEQELNPEECIYRNYWVNPPHRIQIDTTVVFPDGTEQRVLWGPPSDFMETITARDFVDSILAEEPRSKNMLLPLNAIHNWENASFYFVDGWGVMRTPANHRNIYMTGIIKPDGKVYGYHFRRSFIAPGRLRMSQPEAGKRGVLPDDDGKIMFRWYSAANAENYQLQIALDDKFDGEDIVVDIRDIEDTTKSIVADELESNSKYWWRVRANNELYDGTWWTMFPHETSRSFTTGKLVSTWQEGEFPEEITLHQNYPNPFNPVTTISYDLPGQIDVRLEIFDILGRHVATLVDEIQPPGTYQISWDASGVASGSYIYRITAGDVIQSRQTMVIK